MKALKNILFLDIETVRSEQDYDKLDERMKFHWARKSSFLKQEEGSTPESLYSERAGIYAEFGKIISIGLGFFHEADGQVKLRLKGLYDDDETSLLERFKEVLGKLGSDLRLCAHNGKEFDFPYLNRRFLINGLTIPEVLQIAGKKPWEVQHIDTMDFWKFGDWKNFTSLDLLASIFGIASSKQDMDGSQVSQVYYETGELKRISDYCLNDVKVTALLYLKLNSIHIDNFTVEIVDSN